MKVAPDGSVYFRVSVVGAFGIEMIWKISGGVLQRVAGKWFAPYEPGLNPLQASMGEIHDFTIDRDGALTALSQAAFDIGPYSLRRIGPAQPGFDAAEFHVAARDGGEIYIFNANGLHLRTLNTLTGTTNWLFTYNSSNLVTQLRERDGQVTTIERAAKRNSDRHRRPIRETHHARLEWQRLPDGSDRSRRCQRHARLQHRRFADFNHRAARKHIRCHLRLKGPSEPNERSRRWRGASEPLST
jgi:hypothetical protein